MPKINSKFLLFAFCFLLLGLLVYSRFVNLGWGLPYPMHPDERNMAVAVQSLNCDKFQVPSSKFQISECMNPHFFAYGQFPLYLSYGITMIQKFFDGDLGRPISFEEAVISLRLISALASILNVLVLLRIISLISSKFPASPTGRQVPNSKQISITNYQLPITFLVLIFSPFFIQFSHFGTTESLLMLFYSTIVYLSLLFSAKKIPISNFLLLTSLVSGLAMASKVSSVIYLIIPVFVLKDSFKNNFFAFIKLAAMSLLFSIVFSPHNFISFNDFLGSIRYESDIALGNYRAFYTRLFDQTTPVLFQLEKIFPYVLGWPAFILGILGILLLSWRKKEYNLLRIAIIVNFFPNAFLFAKWTRFIAPTLPLMLVVAILFLQKIKPDVIKVIVTLLLIIPGIAYLSIYQNPDVRFTASEWIYKNIPANSYILSETANVVDLPVLPTNYELPTMNYKYISFDFYHLDDDPYLKLQLDQHLAKADYIFVPTRRLFMNNTCIKLQTSNFKPQTDKRCNYLKKKYPLLNEYYEKLFSGKLGFEKVAEFTSYPKINFRFSISNFQFEIPDENSEETWTVFDHPVVRIYRRIQFF